MLHNLTIQVMPESSLSPEGTQDWKGTLSGSSLSLGPSAMCAENCGSLLLETLIHILTLLAGISKSLVGSTEIQLQ